MRLPSRRTFVAAALAVVVALVAVAVLLPSDRVFRDRVAALRAEGFAVTTAEFLGPAPPDAAEAAAEIQAAWDALEGAAGFPDRMESGITGPWATDDADPWHVTASPERMQALVAWLEAARPFYDRLSAALERPAIRFPVELDAYGLPDFKPVAFTQRLTRLLTARARVAPDPADRIAACRDLLRFGRRRVPEGTIARMVGAFLERTAVVELRDGVESGALDARAARAAVDADLLPRPPGDRERIARGCVVETAEMWGAVLAGWELTGPFFRKPTVWDRVAAACRRILSRKPDDAWDSAVAAEILDHWAAIARDPSRWPRASDPPHADRRVQDATRVALSVDESLRKVEAATRLARVALAVRQRRTETGRWPARLDEVADLFGGAVPDDPFTAAPFTYEVGADGARLASVGRIDGDAQLSDEDRRERGLVWEFGDPPAREDAR